MPANHQTDVFCRKPKEFGLGRILESTFNSFFAGWGGRGYLRAANTVASGFSTSLPKALDYLNLIFLLQSSKHGRFKAGVERGQNLSRDKGIVLNQSLLPNTQHEFCPFKSRRAFLQSFVAD